MRYHVDAHALIWSQDSPEQLGAAAKDALTDLSHELLVGKGTIWEMGIKASTGKLPLSKPFDEWIDTAIRDLRLTIVEIELAHIIRVSTLSFPKKHRDPFDRILAVQSLVTNIPIISVDPLLDDYGITRIWN
jgi:PIN domain nuclease of toxin-antitoxin system